MTVTNWVNYADFNDKWNIVMKRHACVPLYFSLICFSSSNPFILLTNETIWMWSEPPITFPTLKNDIIAMLKCFHFWFLFSTFVCEELACKHIWVLTSACWSNFRLSFPSDLCKRCRSTSRLVNTAARPNINSNISITLEVSQRALALCRSWPRLSTCRRVVFRFFPEKRSRNQIPSNSKLLVSRLFCSVE